jgi:hypothetical protein
MKWRARTSVVFGRRAAFPQGEYDERLPWHFRMTGRPSWKRLLEATAVIAEAAGSKELVVCAGDETPWMNVPKRVSRSAIEVASASEAVDFIRKNSHYRSDTFVDYYVTDGSLSWLTKFCHDDDWHAFLPEKIACALVVKRAYFALRFSSMPPWPVAGLYE